MAVVFENMHYGDGSKNYTNFAKHTEGHTLCPSDSSSEMTSCQLCALEVCTAASPLRLWKNVGNVSFPVFENETDGISFAVGLRGLSDGVVLPVFVQPDLFYFQGDTVYRIVNMSGSFAASNLPSLNTTEILSVNDTWKGQISAMHLVDVNHDGILDIQFQGFLMVKFLYPASWAKLIVHRFNLRARLRILCQTELPHPAHCQHQSRTKISSVLFSLTHPDARLSSKGFHKLLWKT